MKAPSPPRSSIFPYPTLFRSVVNSLEGVGIVVTGAPEVYDGKLDAGAEGEAADDVQLMSSKQTYNVDESNPIAMRSEEHTSELQSRGQLVCRLLLEKEPNVTE